MKKRLLLLIPIFAGVFLGEIIFSPAKTEKIISPEAEPPSGRKETKLAAALLSNSQIVSDHLLKSQTLFSKAIELSGQNNDSSQNERIARLINEAITEATEAIITNSQDARGYAQRGKIYKAIEEYLDEAVTAALADYQQAVRLNPRQVDYYQEVASLLLALDRKAEAVSALKNCVYINPTEAQGWYELANLEAELGMLAEAKGSYQRILTLVIDEGQKETVRGKISAIDLLLAQAGEAASAVKENPVPSPKEIVFPHEPPRMEAKAVSKVIIAEPGEKRGGESQFASASNAFSGTAVLPAGEKELRVENKNLKTDSQVYLAAEGDIQNEVLRVKSKASGWFTVTISRPLSQDVSFRWWIINQPGTD